MVLDPHDPHGLSGQHPLHHAGTDANLAADLQDAHAALAELVNSFFHRSLHSAASKLGALSARPCKPGVDSFPNDASLELSEHAKHLKHRLARGGRGDKPL